MDKVTPIVEKVLKDHPELFYIEEWSLTKMVILALNILLVTKTILKLSKTIKYHCSTNQR